MGTAAGLHFQQLFSRICNENGIRGDQDYPEWIYFNASQAPDRSAALLNRGPSPTPYLISVMEKMQSAGVEIVVVVCNTAHAFQREITSQVAIPWIDLQRETARVVKIAGYHSVALMATEGTVLSGLFRDAVQPLGIPYYEPDSEMQEEITAAIYDPQFGIKSTGTTVSDMAAAQLQSVIDRFDVDAIIAGCTELSFAFSQLKITVDWLDPVEIAARTLFDIWHGHRSFQTL